MIRKLEFLLRPVRSRKILLVGSGRSGTHWLARILEAHPGVRATIEGTETFDRVTRMALDPTLRPGLLPSVVRYYRRQHFLSHPRHYLDKSHPNLWIAEDLARALPDALFLGIERSPEGTIASMLEHRGVQKWHERWRDYPVPNAFLGITEEGARGYDALAPVEKFALRWSAHHAEMARLADVLGERMLVVHYEDLFARSDEILEEIRAFVGLDSPIPRPEIRAESLRKWEDRLSDEQIGQIEAVTRAASGGGGHPG